MKDIYFHNFVLTGTEESFNLTQAVREIMHNCGVETNCPCPEGCQPVPTVTSPIREALEVLAQRVIDLEARVDALENP